jgi:hypothetical protein
MVRRRATGHGLRAWQCVTALVAIAAVSASTQGRGSLTALDQIEIQQLVSKYAWALDSGENSGYGYADLFTPDATFTGMNQGDKGRTYKGREALAALARGGKRGPLFVSHYSTGVIIEATPQGAKGRNYVLIVDPAEGGRAGAITNGGHYEDEYVKTPAGWRFKSRVFFASELGPTPRQLQSPPSEAPVAPAPAATPGPGASAAPAAQPRTSLTADEFLQIRQLVAGYAFALDGGGDNGYAYADLFAPGAEFIRPYTTGRDNLARLALDQPHGPLYTRHFITNHVIESTAAGVAGKQYLLVADISETREKPGSIFLAGHYEDQYAKTDRGWRFKRREFIPSRPGPAQPSR